MTTIGKATGLVGICIAVVLAYNACFLALGDPGNAARAKAIELGWVESDIDVIGVTYSSTLVSWDSSLRFRSRSRPEWGEVLVEVRKPTPFHGWRMSRYESQRSGSSDLMSARKR